MATYSKYFDKRNKTAERWPLKIKISHKGVPDYISTGYRLKEDEWNADKELVQKPYEGIGEANATIARKYAIVGETISKLAPRLNELHVKQIKTIAEDQIQKEFDKKLEEESPQIIQSIIESEKAVSPSFNDYAKKIAEEFFNTDRGGSGKTVDQMLTSLNTYTGNRNLSFADITVSFLKSYENWYLRQVNKEGKRNTLNGLGFRTKDIRRVYNLAIEDKNCPVKEESYPFGRGKYRIRKEKTNHRNVDASEITKIFKLGLTEGTRLWHHLNYFKFYFECWGMNFMDVAHLKVYQVQNGKLKYTRRKTRWSDNAKRFDIVLSKTAQEIVDYYTKNKKAGDFVFDIINDIEHLRYTDGMLFQKKLDMIGANHSVRMRSISKKAGVDGNVTSYVARHSFFSIALTNGVPLSEINGMAGHGDFKTTEVYVEGFDADHLANSAEKVLNAIHKDEYSMLLKDLVIEEDNDSVPVYQFLLDELESAPEVNRSTSLVISLLSKTSVKDGAEAQANVNAFLDSLENTDLAIAS